LGNAIDRERGYQGFMQQFERGFMLQTDAGTIYVFYNDGRWERRVAAISPDNPAQVVQLSRLVKGTEEKVTWSPDERVLAMAPWSSD
jgi:hypothetical protein